MEDEPANAGRRVTGWIGSKRPTRFPPLRRRLVSRPLPSRRAARPKSASKAAIVVVNHDNGPRINGRIFVAQGDELPAAGPTHVVVPRDVMSEVLQKPSDEVGILGVEIGAHLVGRRTFGTEGPLQERERQHLADRAVLLHQFSLNVGHRFSHSSHGLVRLRSPISEVGFIYSTNSTTDGQ